MSSTLVSGNAAGATLERYRGPRTQITAIDADLARRARRITRDIASGQYDDRLTDPGLPATIRLASDLSIARVIEGSLRGEVTSLRAPQAGDRAPGDHPSDGHDLPALQWSVDLAGPEATLPLVVGSIELGNQILNLRPRPGTGHHHVLQFDTLYDPDHMTDEQARSQRIAAQQAVNRISEELQRIGEVFDQFNEWIEELVRQAVDDRKVTLDRQTWFQAAINKPVD
jgi:hypothetical protein